MEINDELLNYLSRLSRIEIAAEEKDKLKKDLSDIISWMEKLQQLNTEGVEPLITMSREENLPAVDEVGKHLDRTQALANAPNKDEKFIKVPKVKR